MAKTVKTKKALKSTTRPPKPKGSKVKILKAAPKAKASKPKKVSKTTILKVKASKPAAAKGSKRLKAKGSKVVASKAKTVKAKASKVKAPTATKALKVRNAPQASHVPATKTLQKKGVAVVPKAVKKPPKISSKKSYAPKAQSKVTTTAAARSFVPPPEEPPVAAPAGETRVGTVTHYYPNLGVVAVSVSDQGEFKIGDMIHIMGSRTDFTQRVESLEIDHQPVTHVTAGESVGIEINDSASVGDCVYRVNP